MDQQSQPGSRGSCGAKTKRGRPCKAAVVYGTHFCALHGNPTRAAELGRMGGRKNRHYVDNDEVIIAPPTTPEDVKNLLAQAMVDVRAKKLDLRIASTLISMSGALLKAFENADTERRIVLLEEALLRRNTDKS